MASKKKTKDDEVARGFVPKSRIFSIIENNSPPSKVFSIVLPKGDFMEFKAFDSWAEKAICHAAAEDFGQQIEQVKSMPGKEHLAHLSEADFRASYVIGFMSTEFEPGHILEIAAANTDLLQYIAKAVDRAGFGDELVLMKQGLDAAKKESGHPSSTETD